MASGRNDITGDKLVSKPTNQAFEDGYDLAFGKKKARKVIALLDGDIFMYRIGFTTEDEDEAIAKFRIDEMIQSCLDETFSTEHRIFITSGENFRKALDPQYKANRIDKPRPKHLPMLKEHLITKWNAEVAVGMEADDYLAINQTNESIICTIDKDLKQVVGEHYNFVKKEFSVVNELQGLLTFYSQFLIGDASDNIIGVKGIGPVGAAKYLQHLPTEVDMFNAVRLVYKDDERMRLNGQLLWMLRSLDDDWGVRFDKLKDNNEWMD